MGRTFDGGDLLDDGVHPPAIDDPCAHQLACGYTKRGETRGSVRVRDGRAGRGEKATTRIRKSRGRHHGEVNAPFHVHR